MYTVPRRGAVEFFLCLFWKKQLGSPPRFVCTSCFLQTILRLNQASKLHNPESVSWGRWGCEWIEEYYTFWCILVSWRNHQIFNWIQFLLFLWFQETSCCVCSCTFFLYFSHHSLHTWTAFSWLVHLSTNQLLPPLCLPSCHSCSWFPLVQPVPLMCCCEPGFYWYFLCFPFPFFHFTSDILDFPRCVRHVHGFVRKVFLLWSLTVVCMWVLKQPHPKHPWSD